MGKQRKGFRHFKVAVDKADPYFCSLLSATIISHRSGIGLQHLRDNPKVPNILTSISRFYVYYHMKRFLRDPDKMTKYITKDVTDLVKKNLPTRKIWEDKFYHTKENIGTWLAEQRKKGRQIRHATYECANFGGVLGIKYQQVKNVINSSDDDWTKFIQPTSNGLTKTGQLLFQKAAEAYVYCVLGSQAKTHWQIVGAGVRSLQTQEIFEKLVKDVVVQDNDNVAISNMRTAIKATNVVLNIVISPGIILIPSNMLILKDKIPGYNNVLTLATKNMKFGTNENLNHKAPVRHVTVTPVTAKVPVATTGPISDHHLTVGYIFLWTVLQGSKI